MPAGQIVLIEIECFFRYIQIATSYFFCMFLSQPCKEAIWFTYFHRHDFSETLMA